MLSNQPTSRRKAARKKPCLSNWTWFSTLMQQFDGLSTGDLIVLVEPVIGAAFWLAVIVIWVMLRKWLRKTPVNSNVGRLQAIARSAGQRQNAV